MKKRILWITDYYLPGVKAGGLLRAAVNTVEWLGDEFQFFVLAGDRDFGADRPYTGIHTGVWTPVGKAQVMYLDRQQCTLRAWNRLLNRLDYDLIYLHSFFSPTNVKTLLLRRLGQLPRKPFILAPNGELAPNALAIKPFKKQVYIDLTRWTGFYRNLSWRITNDPEKAFVLRMFCRSSEDSANRIRFVPNPPNRIPASIAERPAKQPGSARIIFLSRIARIKNLVMAIQCLAQLEGEVTFDIYGPIEDQDYWRECEALIRQLPDNIRVSYRGIAPGDGVVGIFSQYHLFLFPTQSESFGYVIFEALSAGTPVLTSTGTPWKDLAEKQGGWTIPLTEPGQYVDLLRRFLAMDDAAFRQYSEAAYAYVEAFVARPDVLEAHRQLFLEAE